MSTFSPISAKSISSSNLRRNSECQLLLPRKIATAAVAPEYKFVWFIANPIESTENFVWCLAENVCNWNEIWFTPLYHKVREMAEISRLWRITLSEGMKNVSFFPFFFIEKYFAFWGTSVSYSGSVTAATNLVIICWKCMILFWVGMPESFKLYHFYSLSPS